MNMGESIQTCLFEKYATFEGRASRSEYWWFYLFQILLYIVVGVIEAVMFGPASSVVSNILTLAFLVPTIAVTARRLHDVGRSGWWQLLILTVIGALVVLYWLIIKGEEEENDFGPDPVLA